MWMRLIGGTVCDLATVDPATLYSADVAAQFVQVPAGAPSGLCQGYGYDGKTWTPPSVAVLPPSPSPLPPVPNSVTNYQARFALIAAGLFSEVDAAIKGADLTVPANLEALQAWEYANNFFRTEAFIVALGPSFGLQPSDIDNLFRAAALVP